MKKMLKPITSALAIAGVAASLMVVAPSAIAEESEINDPLEPLNRAFFVFNEVVDNFLLRPVVFMYKFWLPPIAQDGVHNFLNNLRTPVILINNVLQGDMDGASNTVGRFAVNSTIGVLGFGDPASDMGMEFRNEDFGQTLGVWGLEDGGPYLVLPIFGPSNPRDATGLVVDYFADPINWYADNTDKDWIGPTRAVVTAGVNRGRTFEEIEEMKRTSLDFYATVRSLYLQNRASEIRNGAGAGDKEAPGLSFDFDAPSPGDDEELSETR